MKILRKHIKSNITESAYLEGKFIISNLEKGQGLTIGNALRRTLLSNLKGTALIAIRIKGINHEFSALYGIREDIFEILLNLKEISLKMNKNENISYGTLIAEGPGIITSNNLHFTSNINIINPNQYIATIYIKKKIKFNIIAIKNKGYNLNNNYELQYTNFINIDTLFNPIIKVNYKIIEQNPIKNKKKELTLIEIKTNGSMTPEYAFLKASFLLKIVFKKLILL